MEPSVKGCNRDLLASLMLARSSSCVCLREMDSRTNRHRSFIPSTSGACARWLWWRMYAWPACFVVVVAREAGHYDRIAAVGSYFLVVCFVVFASIIPGTCTRNGFLCRPRRRCCAFFFLPWHVRLMAPATAAVRCFSRGSSPCFLLFYAARQVAKPS